VKRPQDETSWGRFFSTEAATFEDVPTLPLTPHHPAESIVSRGDRATCSGGGNGHVGFRLFSTGIKMETAALVRLRRYEVRCPHCQAPHRISDIGARIAEDEVSVVLPVMAGLAAFR
jgi:hypothetical protein